MLLAAFLVKQLPLATLRWLVVLVVIYADTTMLRSSLAARVQLRSFLDVLYKPQRIVNGGMGVARRDRVTNPEKPELSRRIGLDSLCPTTS